LEFADSFKLLISPKVYAMSDQARQELKKNELKFKLFSVGLGNRGTQPSVTPNYHKLTRGVKKIRGVVKLIFICAEIHTSCGRDVSLIKNIERKGKERKGKKEEKEERKPNKEANGRRKLYVSLPKH
jgi:hypothetical protein